MAVGLGTMREELQETSVDALFRGETERLLKRPKAQEELEKICKSERGDHRLRVLAHELLLMLGKNPDPKMNRIYCEAVAGAFMHQWWGLPGHHIGKFSETLLRYSENALPHLVLEIDNGEKLKYLGPDAAICRKNEYCVGDLYAYLCCLILKRDYPDDENPDERLRTRMQLRDEIVAKLINDKKR